jgi:hypothetical protein
MITLTCTDPATSIELPNPLLGNTLTRDHKTIVRTTRAGEYRIAIPVGRVPITTRKFEFRGLIGTKVTALQTFLTNTAGKELTLIDHLGAESTCYILTPAFNIVTRRDDCSYDVGFEILDYTGLAVTTYNLLTQTEESVLLENTEELHYEH